MTASLSLSALRRLTPLSWLKNAPNVGAILSLIVLGCLAFPTVGSAAVTGGPGYARALTGASIDDDFSGGTLDRRYQLIGVGTAPQGSAAERDGMLYLTAGPTTGEAKIEAAIQRYFFTHRSFHLQVDAGCSSESTVMCTAGLAIFNPLETDDSFSRIGIAMMFEPGWGESRIFSNVPAASGNPAGQPFTMTTDRLYRLELEYEAVTQTLILAVPEAG